MDYVELIKAGRRAFWRWFLDTGRAAQAARASHDKYRIRA
jgi:hypothetical protein